VLVCWLPTTEVSISFALTVCPSWPLFAKQRIITTFLNKASEKAVTFASSVFHWRQSFKGGRKPAMKMPSAECPDMAMNQGPIYADLLLQREATDAV
jgi:hypothetical protein